MDAMPPTVAHLLSTIQGRQRFAARLHASTRLAVLLAAVASVLVLSLRLPGLHEVPIDLWQWFAGAVVILSAPFLFRTKTTRRQAAIVADRELASDDLFLSALASDSGSAYLDSVRQKAEVCAQQAVPEQLVPYALRRPVTTITISLILGALFLQFTPMLDPFGIQSRTEEIRQIRQQLVQQTDDAKQERNAAREKIESLGQQTEETLEDLLNTFKSMKPKETERNATQLAMRQQELSRQWEKLRSAGKQTEARKTSQTFGRRDEQSRAIEQALSSGNTKPLRDALKRASDTLNKMQNASSEAERQKLEQAMKQQLQSLAEATAGNPQLAALQQQLAQAIQQGNLSSVAGLQQDALNALQQSLQNARASAQDLEQAMKQMQELSDAMNACQNAQQCNSQGSVGQCAGGLEAYSTMYQQMVSQLRGAGGGMKGPGTGEGGLAPEDPDQDMQSQPSRVDAGFRRGEVVASWKVEGEGGKGEIKRNYRYYVPKTDQEVSEAILREEIPAGYQQGIQEYFKNDPAP